MIKILGSDWKTTLAGIGTAIFGLLTTLSALPYQLGDVATIIPPSWKAKVFTVGAVAMFLIRVWNGIITKQVSK
jgi:hypothetical protein